MKCHVCATNDSKMVVSTLDIIPVCDHGLFHVDDVYPMDVDIISEDGYLLSADVHWAVVNAVR